MLIEDEDQHLFIFLALDRINVSYVPLDINIPRLQLPIDIDTLHLKNW